MVIPSRVMLETPWTRLEPQTFTLPEAPSSAQAASLWFGGDRWARSARPNSQIDDSRRVPESAAMDIGLMKRALGLDYYFRLQRWLAAEVMTAPPKRQAAAPSKHRPHSKSKTSRQRSMRR